MPVRRGHTARHGGAGCALRAGMDPDGFMRQCAGDPGPFTLIFPGMGPVHFVASVDAAREILTAPREVLCAPTPNPIEPIVGPESVILTSGAVHRRQRTLLSPCLPRRANAETAEGMASAVIDEISPWRAGDRVALHTAAQSITLRIIIQVVLGVAAGPACEAYADVVSALMNANTAPLMLLPILRKNFAGLGPWARLVKLRSQFDSLLSDQIRSGPQCPVTGRGPILTELLAASDDDEALSEDELQQQLRTLVIAGHDTTAAALAWALYHIHREPRVWQRLTAELCADPRPSNWRNCPICRPSSQRPCGCTPRCRLCSESSSQREPSPARSARRATSSG